VEVRFGTAAVYFPRAVDLQGTQWAVLSQRSASVGARPHDPIAREQGAGALLGRPGTGHRSERNDDDARRRHSTAPHLRIRVAPVRPAEFVIFRIFQDSSEARR
jgi:phage tail sheath protein FI